MIYTVFSKENDSSIVPADFSTFEQALAYCKEKGYIAGRDCLIERTAGDCE